ncbi:hypothetical protein M0P48_02710 [Candidatus Gracilibacteria bacterium]|nr:hypothetical protein [Candidatus Gracilibacteria bacterium]
MPKDVYILSIDIKHTIDMQTDNTLSTYSLDRKTASRLLKVSIRTLDRYIKAKKLSSRVDSGHIWLNKEEVRKFKSGRLSTVIVDDVDMSTPRMSIDMTMGTSIDNVDKVEVIEAKDKQKVPKEENEIYKKLYFDVKEELNMKQERLEMANYRVGQLESQLRSSIPMLEFHRDKYQADKEKQELKDKIEIKEKEVKEVFSRVKIERFNKRILLIILLFTLALQPFWLFLYYR